MIYLDNAATTFPKPESVYDEMDKANRTLAVNAGRGSYKAAREATAIIDDTNTIHFLNDESRFLTKELGVTYYIKEALEFTTPRLIMLEGYAASRTAEYEDHDNVVKNTFGIR